MKRILLVQNPSDDSVLEREQKNYQVALGEGVALTHLSSLDTVLSKKDPEEILAGFSGVIFGGSRDYDFDGGRKMDDPFRILALFISERTKNLIRHALMEDIPGLGICFGHQMTANLFGSEVRHDPAQSNRGTGLVTLTEDGTRDVLFKNLPPTFDAQYGHKDSVMRLPKGATLLATGDRCHFSALRYGESMYTVQFHPEITAERMIKSMNSHSDSLPVGIKNATEVVRDSKHASKIIPLWLKYIVGARG